MQTRRRDPVYVSRVLSAMINSNDDKGVLLGNWSGTYSGGVNPSRWTGSMAILRQWNDSNCRQVHYGQCWVFAAVDCTVARALGIPCRVITNYASAHDSNDNLMIEVYVDEQGNRLKGITSESTWNYHCWVEGWMTRPDLKPGYDGWQASDATPQEQSKAFLGSKTGVYCCGPVPVKAIKEGDLTCKYDAPFVYAEVNADIIYKCKSRDGRVSEIVDKTTVGQKISTKSVGQDTREDITHLYKYPESSGKEREIFRRARICQDVDVCIKGSQDMKKGSDFEVLTLIKNKTTAIKKVTLLLVSKAISYNGVQGEVCCMEQDHDYSLGPGEELRVPLRHKYSMYAKLLSQTSQLQAMALIYDSSTQMRMMEKRIITLQDPEITVKILGEPKVNRRLAAEITLLNPLPETLDNCSFTVEGVNLTSGETIKRRIASVGPGLEAKAKVYFTPSSRGPRKLMVDFYSNKLGHVKGFRSIIIG